MSRAQKRGSGRYCRKVSKGAKIRYRYNQVPHLTDLMVLSPLFALTGRSIQKYRPSINCSLIGKFGFGFDLILYVPVNSYGHVGTVSSLPLIQEGMLSVTSESVCMKYWLTLSSLPRKNV